MTQNNANPLQEKIEKQINDFMGSVLQKGELLAQTPEIFDHFRRQVLREGNDIIRDLNKDMRFYIVKMKISPTEYKQMRKSVVQAEGIEDGSIQRE